MQGSIDVCRCDSQEPSVSARKPCVTHITNTSIRNPSTEAPQNLPKDIAISKQFTSFSIENIVNHGQNKDKPALSPDDRSQKNCVSVITSLKSSIELSNTVFTSKANYSFGDMSSEVKHASTPIDKSPDQTHSPQLPMPSPNYPKSALESLDYHNAFVPQNTSHIVDNIEYQSHSTNNVVLKKQISDCNVKKKFRNNKATSQYVKQGENNFTVLNIPNVALQGPPSKRQKMSKIDLATVRRKFIKSNQTKIVKSYSESKITMDYGVTIIGYSDSSSEESVCNSSDDDYEDEKEVDLLIKSGPPLRPELNPPKMQFLKIFELTTHTVKNTLELHKLEKRKWLSPEVPQEPINETIFSLNLPVPLKSPSFNVLQNHKLKRSFFQLLGLKNVTYEAKMEYEKDWMEIIKERLKRNCVSSVTKYSQKDYRKNGLITKDRKTYHREDLSPKLPIVHQYKGHIKPEDCSNLVLNKLVEKINCVPLTMILVENKDCNENLESRKENKIDTRQDDKFRWPGVLEIMESYRRYSKERNMKIIQLKKQSSLMSVLTAKKQSEVKLLEKKQRDLHSTLFRNERECKHLQRIVDQLANIINAFR